MLAFLKGEALIHLEARRNQFLFTCLGSTDKRTRGEGHVGHTLSVTATPNLAPTLINNRPNYYVLLCRLSDYIDTAEGSDLVANLEPAFLWGRRRLWFLNEGSGIRPKDQAFAWVASTAY